VAVAFEVFVLEVHELGDGQCRFDGVDEHHGVRHFFVSDISVTQEGHDLLLGFLELELQVREGGYHQILEFLCEVVAEDRLSDLHKV